MLAKLSERVLGISSELDSRARFVPLTFRHFVSPGIAHYGCSTLCRADVKPPSRDVARQALTVHIVNLDRTATKPAVVVVRQNLYTLTVSVQRPSEPTIVFAREVLASDYALVESPGFSVQIFQHHQ